jgi:hypothetical protein
MPCGPRELAEDDLAHWQVLARDALPTAFGSSANCPANVVYLAAASGSEPAKYRVEVSWRPPGAEAPASLSGEMLLVSGGPA